MTYARKGLKKSKKIDERRGEGIEVQGGTEGTLETEMGEGEARRERDGCQVISCDSDEERKRACIARRRL